MRKTKLNINKIADKEVSPEKALKRAQMKVLGKDPFIATVMLNLQHKFTKDIPSAATNGLSIQYNPDFLSQLSPGEQVFLVAHETLHVAFRHAERLGLRVPSRWNQACDYVINALLKTRDIGTMPPRGLYHREYVAKSAEEVYELLNEENPPHGDSDAIDPFGEDILPQSIDAPVKLTPEENMKLDEILVRAKDQALKQDQWGNMPGYIKDLLDSVTAPKHNWKEQLRDFVAEKTKNDYSWKRPNRRTEPDIYLPSLYSENTRSVVIAVDTSGSIFPNELNAFLREISAIHRDTQPIETHVIAVDTTIHETYTYDAWDNIPSSLELGGRGGTSFQPAFDWANKRDPSCLIYLTDLYAPAPETPGYPTLWVSTTKENTGPFGRTIYLDLT